MNCIIGTQLRLELELLLAMTMMDWRKCHCRCYVRVGPLSLRLWRGGDSESLSTKGQKWAGSRAKYRDNKIMQKSIYISVMGISSRDFHYTTVLDSATLDIMVFNIHSFMVASGAE